MYDRSSGDVIRDGGAWGEVCNLVYMLLFFFLFVVVGFLLFIVTLCLFIMSVC